uniref:Protein TIFY n=1 Tax=Leersia perrieri TaxID=77586 RepID=A0A0D9VQA1_9ORYZ
MASTDPVTRRFAVACGVLSQYVKATSPQLPSSSSSSSPAAAAAEGEEQQFTIFYGGKVVVIDRCSPAMAAELIRYASSSAAAAAAPETTTAPALVDMPIARKASLQRFLAKRKDRATARPSPYGRPAATAAAAEKEMQPPPAKKMKGKAVAAEQDWLALGSLGDMHSR